MDITERFTRQLAVALGFLTLATLIAACGRGTSAPPTPTAVPATVTRRPPTPTATPAPPTQTPTVSVPTSTPTALPTVESTLPPTATHVPPTDTPEPAPSPLPATPSAVATPVVKILYPLSGTQFAYGQETRVQYAANSEAGITRIEIWLDGELYETLPIANAPQREVTGSRSWSISDAGQHVVAILAYDGQGEVGTAEVTVTVLPPA